MNSSPTTVDQDATAPRQRLQLSTFDQVASLLISVLILLGTAVLAMVLIVMTTRKTVATPTVPVVFAEEGYGRGDHEAGTARDATNSPQIEELDEFFPPQMSEPIESVATVISADVASLDTLDQQLATIGTGGGTGTGRGDSRPPGPLGEGSSDVVPRWERWQVRFASADLDSYARQLDFFKIELAAIGGGKDTVDYAAAVSQPKPLHRTGASANEKRLYMTWRSGELVEADKALLAKAGVDTVGRVVLQLYPPETEAALAALEQKQAGTKSLKSIKRTVFGIRGRTNNYEFYVISQEYRTTP